MTARRRSSGPELSDLDVLALDELVATMLVFPDAAGAVIESGLEPADFAVVKHQVVAGLVLDAVHGGVPLDAGEIAAQFTAAGGDAVWLRELIGSAPSPALVPKRIEQVRSIAERAKVTRAVADFYDHRDASRLLADVAGAVAVRGPGVHGFVTADTVRTEAIWWAWHERIPLGELTLLAGFEKVGKSLLCCELVARASRGQLLGDRQGEPMTCLYLTAEDRVGHVIVPRLKLAGADLVRVFVEPVDDDRPVTVERIIAAVVAGVRFVVLDPLSLFIAEGLGDGDERGDLKVRAAMRPIITLAQQRGVAVVGIKHTNKAEGKAILNRVNGSRAYTAAARALLFVADDPDSADQLRPDRLIFPRGNLATTTTALRYRIEGSPVQLDDGEVRDHARIVWRGESARSAEEAFARSDRGPVSEEPVKRRRDPDSAVAYAISWLADALDGRGEVPAVEVLAMAADEGLAERTVQRAAHELGVQRRRDGFGKGSSVFWMAPIGKDIDAGMPAYMTTPATVGIKTSMPAGVLTDDLFAGATVVTDDGETGG